MLESAIEAFKLLLETCLELVWFQLPRALEAWQEVVESCVRSCPSQAAGWTAEAWKEQRFGSEN